MFNGVTRNIIQNSDCIVVIGLPATGKTTFTDNLKHLLPDHQVIHTDDYINKHDFEIIDALNKHQKVIVEGVGGYDIINEYRKKPIDLIIECHASDTERMNRYRNRGRQIPTGYDMLLNSKLKSHQKQSVLRPRHIIINTDPTPMSGMFITNTYMK